MIPRHLGVTHTNTSLRGPCHIGERSTPPTLAKEGKSDTRAKTHTHKLASRPMGTRVWRGQGWVKRTAPVWQSVCSVSISIWSLPVVPLLCLPAGSTLTFSLTVYPPHIHTCIYTHTLITSSCHERDNLPLMEMVWDGVCGGVRGRKKKITKGKRRKRRNKEEDLALGMWWETNGVTQ